MTDAICLADLEAAAAEVLPGPVWDFVAGGSGTEQTMAANRAAFDSVRVVPRVLRDVSARDTSATLLGRLATAPIAVAPMAYQRLLHPDGELAAAEAARRAGIPFTVSALSSQPLERVAEVGALTWFQLYWLRDRVLTLDLVRRAEDAGCAAVLLTADVPWMGKRLRDMRNGFALPPEVTPANLTGASAATVRHAANRNGSAVAAHTGATFAPTLGWDDLETLRRTTSLPILVKGVLEQADAVRAVECGADGVVVSNHGGRQLACAVPSIDAVAHVRAALPQHTVLLDSGVRGGVDVLRALVLGADGVLVGRPFLWGLAAAGVDGAHRALDLLIDELRDALGLAGCPDLASARALRAVRGPAPTS